MGTRFDTILRAEGLNVSLGGRQVLRDVSFTIAPQDVVAIQGASGSGKTTLLRVLAGIQPPDSGVVMFDDQDLTVMPDSARSALRLAEFGFVFQFGDLVPELTLRQNIELPLEFLRVGAKQRRDRVDGLVAAMKLQKCADQLPHTVSGGERQRAAVARSVVHGPNVVFADEPTGSLDTAARDSVLRLLARAARQSACALMIVTHDASVAAVCDKVVHLVDGRIA